MKRIILFGIVIFLLLMVNVFTVVAEDAEEIRLRIGGGQPVEGFTWIESINKYFIPYVDKKLAETDDYKINWIEAWGGTVAKVDECLEAVENGLLDISFVGYVFEPSKLSLNNYSYYVPFNVRLLELDQMVEANMAMYEKYPELNKEFENYRNKLLGLGILESYNFATNFEVKTMDDFQGKKVGGGGSNLAWIKVSGAIPVQSPGTQWYSCVQTGVYDGILGHTLMLDTLKLYEVAPYITLGDFGAVNAGALTINIDYFERLPNEVQLALIEAGEAYAYGNVELEMEKLSIFKDKLEAMENVKLTVLSEEQRNKWVNLLPNLPMQYGQKLDDMGFKGTEMIKSYINFLKEAGADIPRQWFTE